MLNPWQKILGCLLIAALVFTAGWKVRGWKDKAAQEGLEQQIVLAQQKAEIEGQAIAAKYEAQVTALRNNNENLAKEWSNVRQESIADCKLSADALRLLKGNSATQPTAR